MPPSSIVSFHFSAARSLPEVNRRCSTVRKMARSTGNSNFLPCSNRPITCWQPVSRHSRSKTIAGPIGRVSHRDRLAASMGGQQHDRFAELGPRAEQTFELAALLELIEASQRGDDALFAAAALPAVFDDLQVDAISRLLLAKEHGDLLSRTP